MADNFWSFDLVKSGSFAAQLLLENNVPEPVDLSPFEGIRMVVKFSDDQLVWSTDSGEITILSPASNGLVRISLTRSQIEALSFKNANYYLFVDSSAEVSTLILQGTITVK